MVPKLTRVSGVHDFNEHPLPLKDVVSPAQVVGANVQDETSVPLKHVVPPSEGWTMVQLKTVHLFH